MSNKTLPNPSATTWFGAAAIALVFGAMSAHPAPLSSTDVSITIAPVAPSSVQPGSPTPTASVTGAYAPATGTSGATSSRPYNCDSRTGLINQDQKS